MHNYLDLSLIEINKLLKEKKITPKVLVEEAFERIENNKDLNCFITLNKEEALKQAEELKGKEVDSLTFGIPIALKDNILTKGLRTTAASKILENFDPIYDADVVERIKAANMIIIGKTNMDEFAMGSSNRTSFFGPVKNPWNKTRVPGGSSGGSAAAVSKRIIPFALGTDTGGSIRQPASFCGIVGLKPTYGRVSRYGLIAFGSSLDQIGPMTKNVYENAVLLNTICGKSEKDLTSVETNEDFTRLIGEKIDGMKIAIPNFYVSDAIDQEIKDKLNVVIEILKKHNCTIDYVDINYIDKAVPLYQIIAMGEASSNLARFDGIRYGYRAQDIKNLEDLYVKSRSEGFGPEVQRRIMLGTFSLSAGSYDKHFKKAGQVRTLIINDFAKVFEKYDLILGPTTPTPAWDLGARVDDPLSMYLADLLTIPVNLAGLPGISIPAGFADGLPVGMQLIGKRYDEETIYQVAAAFEATTDFHKKQPIIFGK